MAKTNTEPTPRQLSWLLQRMATKQDPITRQQVEAFGRHPGGPILPEECLAVERLPDRFGTRCESQLQLADDNPVHNLAVSPAGALWLATVIGGCSTIVGGRTSTRNDREYWERNVIQLLPDEEWGTMFSPRIVGVQPDGTPVSFLRKVASCNTSAYWEDDAFIFVRGRRVFVGQLPKHRLTAIHVAPDGAVLTAHHVGDKYYVYRNGELLLRPGTTIGRLWQFGDRLVFTGQHDGLFAWSISGRHAEKGVERLASDRDIRDVIECEGALHYVSGAHDGRGAEIVRLLEATGLRTEMTSNVRRIGGHAYLRGFTDLPNGRIAYVAETARDKQECWVVDGVAGPGFDHVTGLLVCDGRAQYWASLGRHLYTMELPSATEAKGGNVEE
jgi:hypothetical protein